MWLYAGTISVQSLAKLHLVRMCLCTNEHLMYTI